MAELVGEVFGDAEILKNLQGLEEALQKKILREAFEEANKMLVSAIEVALSVAGVGTKTGRLKSGIGSRLKSFRGGVFGVAGPLYSVAQHGHLVEFGHRIVVGGTTARASGRTPKASRPNRRGQGRVVGQVQGKPFERMAWEGVKYEVLAKIEQVISGGIMREVSA